MTANGKTIRVVLADDHVMVREALARILEEGGDIAVLHQANNGAEAIEAIQQHQPHVAVLDFSMPVADAPTVIEHLRRVAVPVRTLVLTVHENVHYALRCFEAGADGYLVKSAAVDELATAIRTIRAGGVYISPEVSNKMLGRFRRSSRQRLGIDALSQREFDVLRMLGAGLSLQQCARRMQISTSTASTYRARLMQKLNLTTTADLIRFAIEQDIVG